MKKTIFQVIESDFNSIDVNTTVSNNSAEICTNCISSKPFNIDIDFLLNNFCHALCFIDNVLKDYNVYSIMINTDGSYKIDYKDLSHTYHVYYHDSKGGRHLL